jgi:ribosomal protein S12 methylthiotransferase
MTKNNKESVIETIPSVHLVNMGCSKNQVDSENLLGEFQQAGYQIESSKEEASVVLINTCGFIEAAKEESIQEILDAVREKSPEQKVLVAGCLSQRYMEELKQEIPEADGFFGTYKPGEIIQSIPPIITRHSDCDTGPTSSSRVFLEKAPHHAYLKIAEGCNRVCGFCAIPDMRGKQNSRSIQDIVQEAQDLQSKGVLEISLIAQDLTFFGREKSSGENLTELLKALVSDTDLPWIRLMYAYPAFLEDELLSTIAQNSRICNYMDIPVQHSSSSILKAMRRGYTGKQLRDIIGRLKSTVPNVALRSTVLVGYPGETEEDFEDLAQFVEDTKFHRLGGFTYSDEDGTYACDDLKAPRVSEEVIEERLSYLMAMQQDISLEHNQNKVGETVRVLIDEKANGEEGFDYIGRTEADAPEVDNSVLIHGEGAVPGTFRDVLIEEAYEFDIEGKLLPE